MKIPYYLKFVLTYYVTGITWFSIFRIILLCIHLYGINVNEEERSLVITAMLKGVQFDSVVMGYILCIPALLLIGFSFIPSKEKIYKYMSVYIVTLMLVAFFICAVDIPYFNYNASRLTAVIFNWTPNIKMIISMIAEEKSYWVFAVLFIFLYLTYFIIVKKIIRTQRKEIPASLSVSTRILFSMISLLLVFFSLRGRIDSPIKISHSFFCDHPFYNQLGLNPVFTLVKSFTESRKLNLIDDDIALRNVKKYLNIHNNETYHSPIARQSLSEAASLNLNIVLVIMESMSAERMGHFGNQARLTPFLDSLANESYCFENIYSAGKHTYNGIFSTLYSYPAILAEHPMSAIDIKQYSGFPVTLQAEGYTTMFFTTHSEIFDNLGMFLTANHIEQVISQNYYDKNKIQSAFGVPDHVMFQYAVDTLDKLSQKQKPFFASLMTVSNHAPYIIPEGIPFTPRNKNLSDQIVEYSDWALKDFFERCTHKDWFKKTLFIFVADHGAVVGDSKYEIPLSYHHIPLLMYTSDSSILKPLSVNAFGGQIDIFPTVMDLLHIRFVNNTLGINLLKEKRDYAFFSSDDKIGCIDENYFYIYNTNGSEYLHKYKFGDLKNYMQEEKERANNMKTYSFSMIKTAKYLMNHNETGVETIQQKN